MAWWHRNAMRMIQFNLQAEDAAVDPASLVAWLKEMHANALMTGAGGITAFYPTQLPYHYRSPYLGEGNMLGELIRLCHENEIRVIARFDFSKLHESIALSHPEWLYCDNQGKIVNYHGMVHTCLSGAYQWEHSLVILRECLTQYPADGIYINMFGYHTFDYDGVNHGICHCENCVRLFEQETGLPYPRQTMVQGLGFGPIQGNTEELKALRRWQSQRIHDITQQVIRTVKAINPEMSICTHIDEPIVNMTHTESNTALRRPLPLWIYPSFDNVRLTNDKHNGIVSANCCINAADIGWRFTGVSSAFNRTKLWQQIAAGGQPEWCIVGTPFRYPDKTNFDGVREIYAFHEKNEQYFGRNRSLARIAVVRVDESFPADDGRMDEYRGIVRALKEGHYVFDVITEGNVAAQAANYDLIILPDSSVRPEDLPEGISVIATGDTFRGDAEALKRLFGAEYIRTEEKTTGAYLYNNDKTVFKRMPLRDWLILYDRIDLYKGEGLLPYMAAGVFGPVEIAGGVYPSEYKAALVKQEGCTTRVLLPWWPGRLYTRYGYEDHRDVLLDLVDHILGPQDFRTDAPTQAEAYYDAVPGGRLVQFVNLSGFNGPSVHEPVPMHDIHFSVPKGKAASAIDLRTGEAVSCEETDSRLQITLPVLRDYAAILLPEEENE